MSDNIEITEQEIQKLKELSMAARDTSYAPYSKFRVGAAILTSKGEYFSGANVENASYGAAICAERTAAVKAVTEHQRSFKAIGVASDLNEPCSPCGICRQFLREFTPMAAKVYMFTADGSDYTVLSFDGILPMSFGPEHLS